jgi:hypothetical protein
VLLTLLLVTLSLAVPAAGNPPKDKSEKPYALIFGTVWGPENHPVYGVKVKVRRASDKKARWELYSDHNGEFALHVPAGQADYIVWADLNGFKSSNNKKLQPGPEVTVHIDNDERADIGLHLR